MNIFTTEGKNVSDFSTIFPGAPMICLNSYSDEGNRCLGVRRTLAACRLRWWRSAIWSGITTRRLGTARRCSRMGAFVGSADDYLRLGGGDHARSRKERGWASGMAGDHRVLPVEVICGGVCHLSDRCVLQGGGTCPISCGFQNFRSASSPISRSARWTAYTSLWGTRRPEPVTRF